MSRGQGGGPQLLDDENRDCVRDRSLLCEQAWLVLVYLVASFSVLLVRLEI